MPSCGITQPLIELRKPVGTPETGHRSCPTRGTHVSQNVSSACLADMDSSLAARSRRVHAGASAGCLSEILSGAAIGGRSGAFLGLLGPGGGVVLGHGCAPSCGLYLRELTPPGVSLNSGPKTVPHLLTAYTSVVLAPVPSSYRNTLPVNVPRGGDRLGQPRNRAVESRVSQPVCASALLGPEDAHSGHSLAETTSIQPRVSEGPGPVPALSADRSRPVRPRCHSGRGPRAADRDLEGRELGEAKPGDGARSGPEDSL